MKQTNTEEIIKTSTVNIQVHLNKESLPVAMEWRASDTPVDTQACEAFLLAIWDDNTKQAMRLDLWTKNMKVNEMNHFFFQTFMTMGRTYEKATGDQKLGLKIRDFAQDFANKLELFKEK